MHMLPFWRVHYYKHAFIFYCFLKKYHEMQHHPLYRGTLYNRGCSE